MDSDISDLKISELTDKKFVIYPFMSVQKEFGYSDVTSLHNNPGVVNTAFDLSSMLLGDIKNIGDFFSRVPLQKFNFKEFEDISIPTYLITTPDNQNHTNHFLKQFNNKTEFQLNTISAFIDGDDEFDHWRTYQAIANKAIEQSHDVIIICEQSHEFTIDYSWELLIESIIVGHQLDVDLIFGGAIDCGVVVPISKSWYWVNEMLPTGFTIIFGKFITKIAAQTIVPQMAEMSIFELESTKILLYPTLSSHNHFPKDYYSKSEVNGQKLLFEKMYKRTEQRLNKINVAYLNNWRQNL